MRPAAPLLLTLVLSLVVLCATVLADAAPPPPPYVVIVHPSNPATTLDASFVLDAFLKKITRWPDDEVIRPVDLPPTSPVRQSFSAEVLRRSVDAVKGYWQQRIFSGRDVPPPELETDDDVVRYVLKYPGAIGYVSPRASLNGAKFVAVR